MYINSITNVGGNLISRSKKNITEIVVYNQSKVQFSTKKSVIQTNKSCINKNELLRTRHLSSKIICISTCSLTIYRLI